MYRSPYHTVQIPISHCTDPYITLYRSTIHVSLCADNINTRGVVFVGTCHGRCQRRMGIQGSEANHETPLPTGMSTAVSEWVTHGDDPWTRFSVDIVLGTPLASVPSSAVSCSEPANYMLLILIKLKYTGTSLLQTSEMWKPL